MDLQEMNDMVFCQSCGMPLQNDCDLGTNADGSKNEEYCTYCYQNGNFTEPDITMDEMIDKCSPMLVEVKNMSLEEAKEMNSKFIPQLKRWK
ncbi:MAG: zinc ribbon domain-containing protein [Euryarchaeota archaeon]|nr:zinc ribbon domain-containing protein [Euryarchaeota archaeon]